MPKLAHVLTGPSPAYMSNIGMRWARFIEGDQGATPTPDAVTPKPTEPPTPAAPATPLAEPKPSEEALGEGGLKALQQEREARKALEKQLKEIEDAKLSDLDRASKEAEEAKADAVTARTELAVYKLAAANGITEDADIALLSNVADDVQREALAKRLAAAAAPSTPKPDMSGGAHGEQPASIQEQVSAAEKAGDHARAAALKAQQIGALASK